MFRLLFFFFLSVLLALLWLRLRPRCRLRLRSRWWSLHSRRRLGLRPGLYPGLLLLALDLLLLLTLVLLQLPLLQLPLLQLQLLLPLALLIALLLLMLGGLAGSSAALQSLMFQVLLAALLRRQGPGPLRRADGARPYRPWRARSDGSSSRGSHRAEFPRFGLRRRLGPWPHRTRPGNGRFVAGRRRGSMLDMPWLTRNNGLSWPRSGLARGLELSRLGPDAGLAGSRPCLGRGRWFEGLGFAWHKLLVWRQLMNLLGHVSG